MNGRRTPSEARPDSSVTVALEGRAAPQLPGAALQRWARGLGLGLTLALAVPGGAGCKPRSSGGSEEGSLPPLAPLSLREETPKLLLTWLDPKGGAHTAAHPSEVPAESKERVRVVVVDRDEGTRDPLWVADLRNPGADGSFTALSQARASWEAEIARRRGDRAGPSAPSEASSAAAPQGAPEVIVYGASWCGPCHQADAYLTRRGVAHVMKDIERTPGAADELEAKLEKAHARGGSIPVIDVGGQILVGFSTDAIDRAVARTRRSPGGP